MKEQPAHPGGRGNPPPPQPDQVRPAAGGAGGRRGAGDGRGGGRPPSRRSCAELEKSVREGSGGHGRPRGGSAGGKREPGGAVSGMRWGRPEGTQSRPGAHRGRGVGEPGPGGSGSRRRLRCASPRVAPGEPHGRGMLPRLRGAALAPRERPALRGAPHRGGQGAAPSPGRFPGGDFGSGRAAVTSLGPTVPPRGLAGLRLPGC